MKCQRQLLQISWQQFTRNDKVATTTGLPSISEIISHRRSALFGHVARLQDVPAHKALHCHVDLSLGRPSNDQWKRRPGRPRVERDGLTRSGRTTESPRRTSESERRVVSTNEQCYGPRWLSDDDDEHIKHSVETCGFIS